MMSKHSLKFLINFLVLYKCFALNNTNVTDETIKFELLYSLNLSNNVTHNQIKYLSLYNYTDNTKLIELALYNRIVTGYISDHVFSHLNKTFYIHFLPKEYRSMYYYFLSPNENKTTYSITNPDYTLFISKFKNPFYITIYRKSGLMYSYRDDYKIRGLVLDWDEYKLLLKYSNKILEDSGL